MRALPAGVDTSALLASLRDGWHFAAESVDYAPVGAGSYHWIVRDGNGAQGFVTVDDLDQKSWIGDSPGATFAGLRQRFEIASALRESGLGFVVAPLPTTRGETLLRLGARYSVALFPFVDGEAGEFGHYEPDVRASLVELLAELHAATPAVVSTAPSVGVDLSGRRHLEAGLRELDRPWADGPFSEPARQTLSRHASDVAELLGLADRLAADVESRGARWVITHGEPHALNVLRTGEGYVLVDWDTVALAPPERDLWMVVRDGGDEAALYEAATGHEVDDVAVDFYRLTWDLKDFAEWLNLLRSPHEETEDTARAYDGLKRCASVRRAWEPLL